MTNVVGILVILLVVTQLGVGEAVQRIGKSELAKAKEEAEKLQQERDRLTVTLDAIKPADPTDARNEYNELLAKIAGKESDLEGLRKSKQERTGKIQEQIDAANELLEEHRKKVQEIKLQIAKAESELADLRAQLDNTPQRKVLQAKVVNLPNPRPAPEGAAPLTFICREGRIVFVDIQPAQFRASRWTDSAIRRGRLDRNPVTGIDCKKLFDKFNRERFRDRDFTLELIAQGRIPFLVLKRRENFGETTDEILQASSRYQQGIKQVDHRKYYLQFLVWNDSFDTYLAARRLAAEQGLLAGWQPQTTTAEYKVRLEGKLLCGPKPKPKPKPPQPPKPVDPKPKPPQPPKPPRPIPTDVID